MKNTCDSCDSCYRAKITAENKTNTRISAHFYLLPICDQSAPICYPFDYCDMQRRDTAAARSGVAYSACGMFDGKQNSRVRFLPLIRGG